ncbi:MAG TPA: PAS domain S-box protein, partial [Flavisolibacter sp.]|nr:PAS domain S-box protein [Flavisolibacter sp.]
HPDDGNDYQALKEQSLHTPGNYRHMHRLVRSTGDVLTVNHEWESLADAEGKVVKVAGIVQDITERVEAQKALQKSIALISETEEIAGTGSYEADLSAQTVQFSNGMYRLFGEKPDAIVPSLDFIDMRSHPDDVALIKAVLDDAVRTKQPYHYVRRIYRKDGAVRTLEVHGKVETNEQRNGIRLLGLVQDITERTNAEQQILRLKDAVAQRATDKYLTLFNAIDEGFYQCEIIFDEAGRPVNVLYVEENPAAVRITGRSLIGKTLREVDPDYESYWYEIFGRVALTGESKRMEQYAEPDKKWYEFYVTKVGDGDSHQVAVVFQDVTERRQAIEALRESEERKAFLLKLSDTIREIADPVEIQGTACRILSKYLNVGGVWYGEVADEKVVVIRNNCTNSVQSSASLTTLEFGENAITAYRRHEKVIAGNVITDPRFTEQDREAFASMDAVAIASIGLVKEGHWVAVFGMHHNAPREWTPLEILLLEETAERTWQALEKAKTEAALLKSEEHFRTFVTASSDVFYKMSADWAVMYNLQGTDFLAESASINDTWISQYIPEGEQQRVKEAIEKAIRTKSIFELEHQILNVHGGLSWTHSRAVPKLDENGNILEWFGAARDITAKKKAEEALQDVNARLTDILESTTDAFYALDEDFNFTYVNGRAAQLWNRDAASLIGRHMWTEFPKAAGSESFHHHYRVLQEGEPAHFQTLSPLLGRWLDVGIYPGKGRSLSVFFRDVTERKEAEEKLQNFTAILEQQVAERTKELQKNIAILQHAEELALMGSWEYDNDTGNFNWSDGMYRLFNLPQGSGVNPETYLDFVVEEDRAAAKRVLKYLKKSNQAFEETMQIKRGNERRLLKIKGSVVNQPNGSAGRMVGVDLDITDIKEAEHQLEKSRNLLQQTALASPDAITIYDLQKKQPVYLNNCLAKWIGTSPEELVKMGIEGRLTLIHPDDRLRILHFNEKLKAADDSAVLTLEYRLKGKNDTLLWIQNRAKIFQRNSA